MKNSLKQLLRTPMKTALFFLLMAVATALLVLGANLWAQTQAQMDAVEKQFTTLGTVEQKPNRTQMRTGWDAADGAYYSEAEPVYDSVISADVLDFDGANYLKAPEKRPYYLADLQGLAVRDGGTALFYPVVEFTPAETAVPDHPIKVYVQRFLYPEAENQNNEYEIYVCDHWTENPAPLEAGKTYVAYTNVIVNHHENAKSSIEYALIAAERSTQCDAGGNLLESDMQTRTFDEVTAGFYETERGQYWLELSKALSMWDTTAPVLPVTDTALLPSFHDRTVYVREGRTFSAEDLENGAAVCLVSEEFARKNGLSIGDKVELPLYGVNEKDSPHRTFGDGSGLRTFSLLNAQNRAYTPFWTAKYEIIGTYYSVGTYGKPAGSIEMALNLFLIPANSVKADFAGNIVGSGPMQRATTSFQIPNGTIDDYMAAYNRNVPAEVRENSAFGTGDFGVAALLLHRKTEEAHGDRAEFRHEQKSVPDVACFGRGALERRGGDFGHDREHSAVRQSADARFNRAERAHIQHGIQPLGARRKCGGDGGRREHGRFGSRHPGGDDFADGGIIRDFGQPKSEI